MKLQEIFAAKDEHNICFIDQLDCDDKQNFVECEITLYGIPDNIADEQEDEIYRGDLSKAIDIGKIYGTLILCKQLIDHGKDPYTAADDYSSQTEFIISALQSENGPLNEETGDEYRDIFYIYEIALKKKFNTEKNFKYIVKNLKDIILNLYHVFPEILCYYPQPLPYEENPDIKLKQEAATIIAGELMKDSCDLADVLESQQNEEYHLTLDDEQVNYILGRRNESDVYPESAKDVSIWKRYEKVGFVEVGNSRLLFKA